MIFIRCLQLKQKISYWMQSAINQKGLPSSSGFCMGLGGGERKGKCQICGYWRIFLFQDVSIGCMFFWVCWGFLFVCFENGEFCRKHYYTMQFTDLSKTFLIFRASGVWTKVFTHKFFLLLMQWFCAIYLAVVCGSFSYTVVVFAIIIVHWDCICTANGIVSIQTSTEGRNPVEKNLADTSVSSTIEYCITAKSIIVCYSWVFTVCQRANEES